MDVIRVVGVCQVDSNRHPGVWNVERLGLCFADLGPTVSTGRVLVRLPEVGQLHPIKGEILVLENFSPAIHQRMFLVVVGDAFAAVGFALVPNSAAHRERRQRVNHRVVNSRGRATADLGVSFIVFHLISNLGKFRNRLEASQSRPWLNACATPIGANQTDRHAQFLLQTAPKEIANRAEAGCRFRVTHLPTAGAFFLGQRAGGMAGHIEEPDLRVIRSRDFFFRVHRRTKSPLHVRLA